MSNNDTDRNENVHNGGANYVTPPVCVAEVARPRLAKDREAPCFAVLLCLFPENWASFHGFSTAESSRNPG